MRIRHIRRIAPRPGSAAAVSEHFDQIAEAARQRALSRLRAERAGPERTAAELDRLDQWLRDWRARAPHIAAMNAKD